MNVIEELLARRRVRGPAVSTLGGGSRRRERVSTPNARPHHVGGPIASQIARSDYQMAAGSVGVWI